MRYTWTRFKYDIRTMMPYVLLGVSFGWWVESKAASLFMIVLSYLVTAVVLDAARKIGRR